MRPLSSITQHQSADVDAAPWSYHDVSTDIYTRKHLPSNHARQPCSGTKRSIDVCKYVARKNIFVCHGLLQFSADHSCHSVYCRPDVLKR